MAILMEHLLNGSRRKIDVREIRRNERNFYADLNEDEEFGVLGLAEDIQQYGQKEDIEVYEDDSLDDGKKYTLLSGERRWKAMCYNLENGVGDGMINAIVTRKPETEIEEMNRIISGNHQRDKNESIRMEEVKIEEANWDQLVENGEKPAGKKRVWIGKRINLSERQVQTYLTRLREMREVQENGATITVSGEEFTELAEPEPEGISSSDKENLKQLQKALSESTGRKVKISPKNFGITFYPYDLEDVFAVLNDLGFDEDGTWK